MLLWIAYFLLTQWLKVKKVNKFHSDILRKLVHDLKKQRYNYRLISKMLLAVEYIWNYTCNKLLNVLNNKQLLKRSKHIYNIIQCLVFTIIKNKKNHFAFFSK